MNIEDKFEINGKKYAYQIWDEKGSSPCDNCALKDYDRCQEISCGYVEALHVILNVREDT